MVPDLEEWMDHGGVPLHADGDCEVDGACQSYLGHGQQHRHQVGVPGLTPDTENILEFKRFICSLRVLLNVNCWYSKQEDGHYYVDRVKYCQPQHEVVETLHRELLREHDETHEVAKKTDAAEQNLNKQNLKPFLGLFCSFSHQQHSLRSVFECF